MKLKDFFKFLLFGPLIPLIGVPGEADGEASGEKTGEKDDGNENSKNEKSKNENKEEKNEEKEKYKSQDEFDKALEKRLARERKKFETEFNTKLEREKMDETERAKAEKADAEKKADAAIKTANSRLIKSEVNLKSVELGIIDSEAAYALISKDDIDVDELGNVTGVEVALKNLISRKPYLINKSGEQHQKAGDDQNSANKKTNFGINEMFRRAAGR